MSKFRIVGFAGSASRPSRTRNLVEGIAEAIASRVPAAVSIFDLHDVHPTLGATLDPRQATGKLRELLDAIRSADALVVGSPVYKGTYSGQFKHLFDLVEPEDVVPRSFGPGLPEMRDWVPRHFEFVGQTTVAAEPFERNGGGPLCVAAVGGSGVGEGLLARLVAGYDAAAEQVPGLRMLAVTGPRVDPQQLRAPDGVEVRAYVPDLDRVLATADVALVQGGLTTGMELIAGGTPFVSFPLKRHFEQRIHVAHRLERHGHARALEVEDATPEGVAAAIAAALAEPVDYRPVASGGAARAAQRIAELL